MPKPRLKRGGGASRAKAHAAELRDVHSSIRGSRARQDGHNLHGSSMTAVIQDHAKFNPVAEIEERRDTHVVPRQSVTRKQLLSVFPQRLELEPIPTYNVTIQTDKVTGKSVEVKDPLTGYQRVSWKSDKTLIVGTKPNLDTVGKFKREGSVSVGLNTRKQITPDVDPLIDGPIIGPVLD